VTPSVQLRPGILRSGVARTAGITAAVLVATVALLPGTPAAGTERTAGPGGSGASGTSSAGSSGHWTARPGKPAATKDGHRAEIVATRLRDYTLDRRGMARALDAAPTEGSRAAETDPRVLRVPAPDGSIARFAVQETSVMQPRLAAAHPEIRTYVGTDLDTM
jgi:hypothetical protein